MRGYDNWKTTNPADEYLGPDPTEEPDPDDLRDRQQHDDLIRNRRSQSNTFNSRRPRGINRKPLAR